MLPGVSVAAGVIVGASVGTDVGKSVGDNAGSSVGTGLALRGVAVTAKVAIGVSAA